MLVRTIGWSIAACALAGTTAASAATYDAFDEFVITDGGINAPDFKYGYAPSAFAGAITPFNTFEGANCGGDAHVICAHLNFTDAIGIYKPVSGFDVNGIYASGAATNHHENGFLLLHPAYQGLGYTAAVQFVAQTEGSYSFSGLFKNLDSVASQRVASAYVGTVSEFSYVFNTGDQLFDFSADLLAGQTVTFLVGTGADGYLNDSTGLQLRVAQNGGDVSAVPEPASWAMMVAGIGLSGAALRRRNARVRFARA